MNRKLFISGLMMLAITMHAQTARKFTLNLTDDGKAQMVCFLPENPSGRVCQEVAIRCFRIRTKVIWLPSGLINKVLPISW